jgi:hypothetical protein
VSRSSLGGREYIFRLNPVAYKYAALTSSDPIFHLFPAPIERTDHRISTDIVEASVRRNCFFVISVSMMHNPCFQAIFGLPLVNSMRRDDVGANRNISNFYQIKCLSLIPVNCSCKYDSPIFSRSASLLDDAKGIHETKRAAASSIQLIPIPALKTPKTTGIRFLKRPRTNSEEHSAKRPPERPQPVLAKRPPKQPGPRFGKQGPGRFRGLFGTNPKTTPQNRPRNRF